MVQAGRTGSTSDSETPLDIRTLRAAETEELGRRLAGLLTPGDALALVGPLGAGKTVFVRGIARGLGYQGLVTSPTFAIIHVFEDIRLCHVDAFRLSGGEDLEKAGIEEYLDGSWICAVEWADLVRDALPEGCLCVSITMGAGEDERIVTLESGGGWAARLANMSRGFS